MPSLDGTGPGGAGPLSGGGRGCCVAPANDVLPQRRRRVMPGGDRTGPGGMGPMTGRAAGFCAGAGVPGYANPVGGRGFGGGRGGWGRRNGFRATGLPGWQRAATGLPAWGRGAYAPPAYAPGAGVPAAAAMTGPQELDALRHQAEYLEDALDGIRQRIEQLEADAKKDAKKA